MMWWNDYGPGPWMYFMPVFFILMMGACVFMSVFHDARPPPRPKRLA